MDDRKHSISPDTLYARLGSDAAPIIVDVRRDADFAGAETLLADAFHRSPDAVEQWQTDLPSGRQIVTYCIHGREVSQGVAAALRLMGVDANFLEGGNSKSVWHRARTFRVLCAVACVTCVELGASAQGAAAKIDIGKSQIGAPPSDFDLSQGQWTVVGDATAAAGFAIEQSGTQTTEDRFPLAISKTVPLKNAEISVRLKATGGKSDRDSGLALRLTTPENYYLVELDALRDRVLFSLVNDGVSNEIAAVDADIASQTWHTLTVRAVGDEFVVSLDGNWVFTGFDKTLSQAGRIALWTRGDSVTRFDQIEIAPLP